jgi:uncharacterized membrane-anchored protein
MTMKPLLFCLVVGLQTAWIVGTSLVQEHRLGNNTVVHLETRPVDPRDMLRGDYVILSYDISTVPLDLFQPTPQRDPMDGNEVFVVLEKKGTFHRAVRASMSWPEVQAGQVVIRGRVDRNWSPNVIRINYGLERYYVSEGTGNPRGKLTADATVSKDGRPILKQLYLDGRPYREAMKR